MRPHLGMHSFAILVQQGLALAGHYAKMALHRFTSTGSDELFHLPSLGVKPFPFNVGLFSQEVSDEAMHNPVPKTFSGGGETPRGRGAYGGAGSDNNAGKYQQRGDGQRQWRLLQPRAQR